MFSLLLSAAWVLGTAIAQSTGGELNHHIDINLDGNLVNNPEFTITCTACSVIGDFSLSGGCDDFNCVPDIAPDANFSSLPFDYTEYWIGAVVEDFNVHFEVDIELTPSGPTNEIEIPLLGPNGLSLPENVADVFDITWEFNPTLHGWVNSSKPANFSYGFDFSIPANSAIWIPVLHLDNISTVGFSQSKITPLNYTSTDPNDDFTFELSFRPIFSVTGSVVVDQGLSLSAEIFADVPKLDIQVSQVENVTRDCQPAAGGTAADQIFKNLTLVVPTLSFDFGFNATDIATQTLQIGSNDTLPISCLDYLASASALGAVPSSSVSAAPRLLGTKWTFGALFAVSLVLCML